MNNNAICGYCGLANAHLKGCFGSPDLEPERREIREYGAEEMRERAAKLAEKHKGKAAKDRQAKKGMRFSELPEDAQMEIQAEERGENIASEIIARDIRALPVE